MNTLSNLNVTGSVVEAVGSLIRNDQREKALKYVACGHCNVNSVVVQHAVHDDSTAVVLVTAGITASQRDQIYPARVAYRVDANGKCLDWLPSPASKCSCVVNEFFCAHQLALAAVTAVLGHLSARALPPLLVTAEYLKQFLPEPVLLLESIPMMTSSAFSLPRVFPRGWGQLVDRGFSSCTAAYENLFFPAFAKDLCRSITLDAKLQSSDRYVVETFFSRVKEFLLLSTTVPVERAWQLESAWVCARTCMPRCGRPCPGRPRSRPCATPSPRSWRLLVWRRLAGHFLGCSGNSPKCVVCVVCVLYVFQQYVYNVWCFYEFFLAIISHVIEFNIC